MLGNALLGSSPRLGLAFSTDFMVETDMHEYTHSPWCERWKSPGELSYSLRRRGRGANGKEEKG